MEASLATEARFLYEEKKGEGKSTWKGLKTGTKTSLILVSCYWGNRDKKDMMEQANLGHGKEMDKRIHLQRKDKRTWLGALSFFYY